MIGSADCRTEERTERKGPGGRTASGAAKGRAGGRKSESEENRIGRRASQFGLEIRSI